LESKKHNLLIIQCTCGFELLFLPDMKIMGQAIEKHVLEHKDKYKLTQKQTENLEDYLITQAFKLAAKDPK
jgi:hypothetical protein